MKGVVQFINRQRGLVAVLADDGNYSILRVHETTPIAEEDILGWDELPSMGHATVYNISKNQPIPVDVQAHARDYSQLWSK